MSKVYTNRGKLRLADGTMAGATVNLLAFKGSAPSAGTVADWNFVSDLLGANTEAAASGYARATGVTVTLTENDTNDRVDISYPGTVSMGSSVAAGETWIGVACFRTGASDAARELLWVDVTASSIVTNGSNINYVPANDTLS